MAKNKVKYVCQDCGSIISKWQGQCPECRQWNTLVEALESDLTQKRSGGYAGALPQVQNLASVQLEAVSRISCHITEVDRVLGGGIVPGEVILLGGDPGIGKSSLLIQISSYLSHHHTVLYISGEESLQQIALRARRMGLFEENILLATETNVEAICQLAEKHQPDVMVIDSIQTMQLSDIASASGSVTQVRESTAMLTRFAKQHNCSIFLVGHVTKSGEVAGPRVLEHIVDCVVFIEGQNDGRYRIMRAMKNRFGAVNEIGIFAMTEKGMQQVKNPSALFLSNGQSTNTGSVVCGLWEGSRPLLIEIQALADENAFGQPRRVSIGVDNNRLVMLLAVLHRHGNVFSGDKDIFINVSGGIKVTETSADLALMVAIISSIQNIAIDPEWIIFGEVGLSGEVRPVAYGQERILEAQKHGFKKAIIPKANRPKKSLEHMEVIGIDHVENIQSFI